MTPNTQEPFVVTIGHFGGSRCAIGVGSAGRDFLGVAARQLEARSQ